MSLETNRKEWKRQEVIPLGFTGQMLVRTLNEQSYDNQGLDMLKEIGPNGECKETKCDWILKEVCYDVFTGNGLENYFYLYSKGIDPSTKKPGTYEMWLRFNKPLTSQQ